MKLTYLHVISIPRKEFRNLLFEGNYGHILFVRIEYTSDSVASIQHSWKPANRRMWREVARPLYACKLLMGLGEQYWN